MNSVVEILQIQCKICKMQCKSHTSILDDNNDVDDVDYYYHGEEEGEEKEERRSPSLTISPTVTFLFYWHFLYSV